jgi:hypothetical protein
MDRVGNNRNNSGGLILISWDGANQILKGRAGGAKGGDAGILRGVEGNSGANE